MDVQAEIAVSQIKYYKKSGARLYIPQGVIENPDFPFKDGDIVKIEIGNPGVTLSRPVWWEMVDWNQMRPAFNALPGDTQDLIRAKGLAPE